MAGLEEGLLSRARGNFVERLPKRRRNVGIYLSGPVRFRCPRIPAIFLAAVPRRSAPDTIHHRGWPSLNFFLEDPAASIKDACIR